jgi:hypothetical protein
MRVTEKATLVVARWQNVKHVMDGNLSFIPLKKWRKPPPQVTQILALRVPFLPLLHIHCLCLWHALPTHLSTL